MNSVLASIPIWRANFAIRTSGEKTVANVYVEARPKGRPEGSAIQDYVVEDHANIELGTFRTQKEAIDWAKAKGHAPLVARVRHLNDKKNPDHWRIHRKPAACSSYCAHYRTTSESVVARCSKSDLKLR
jgi:hypothetical protein